MRKFSHVIHVGGDGAMGILLFQRILIFAFSGEKKPTKNLIERKSLQEKTLISSLAANIVLNPKKVKYLNPELMQLQKCVTILI